MAIPVPPNDPNTPIPNDPFYYPQSESIYSELGPLIIGTGLNLDYATGILSANDPGTPAGVTALMAGTGIFLTANTGVITVTNTGVTDIVAGTGISVSNVGSTYTITNLGTGGPSGTVTQINSGAGLTGGPITDAGTLSLTKTGVGAATYQNPTITIDEYGRITFAAPGSVTGYPVQAQYPLQSDGLLPSTLSIAAASTSSRGSVQLNDTVTSTSVLEAATPRAVKQAYDTAATASTNATTALNLATTASTNAANALAASTTAENCASTAISCAAVAQNTANTAITDAANAQSTADAAQTLATTANNTANTAVSSASARVPCGSFVQKGDLLIGTGPGTYVNLGSGADGDVLAVCSSCPSGVYWENLGVIGAGTVSCIGTGTGLVGGPINSIGVIALDVTGVTAGCYVNPTIEVNAEGQIVFAEGGTAVISSLTANAPLTAIGTSNIDLSVAYATGTTSGVVCLHNSLTSTSATLALTAQQGKCLQDQITAVCADKISSISAISPLNATAGINPNLSIDLGTTAAPGAVQLYDGVDSTSTALALTANQGKNLQDQINAIPVSAAIPCSTLTGKGSLVAATSASTPVNLSPGPDGEVLTACSTCAEGLTWAPVNSSGITCEAFTAKGDILVGCAVDTYGALAVPAVAGCVLTSSPTQPQGMLWASPAAPNPAFASLISTSDFALLNQSANFSCLSIPFTQQIEALGFDWEVADPTKLCALANGVYSWNLTFNWCWVDDPSFPLPGNNKVTAVVTAGVNGFALDGGIMYTSAYTGGVSGVDSFSYGGINPISAGDQLEFNLGVTTGCACIASPGSSGIGGASRASLRVQLLDTF